MEVVGCFIYLGSHATKGGGMETVVRCKGNKQCIVLDALMCVIKCRTFNMNTEEGLYEGVVVPTVLCEAETWE